MGSKKAIGNCYKCKKQVEIEVPDKDEIKEGKKPDPAVCPTCGGKLFRIG